MGVVRVSQQCTVQTQTLTVTAITRNTDLCCISLLSVCIVSTIILLSFKAKVHYSASVISKQIETHIKELQDKTPQFKFALVPRMTTLLKRKIEQNENLFNNPTLLDYDSEPKRCKSLAALTEKHQKIENESREDKEEDGAGGVRFVKRLEAG